MRCGPDPSEADPWDVMDRPRARRPRPAGDGEAGFALIEVIVSAVLLIVLALAMLPVLDISASRAGTNRSRSVASNLAKDEQQRLRSLDVSQSLSNYRGTQTKTVDGVDYTVSSRTDWVRDDSGHGELHHRQATRSSTSS